MAVLAEAMEVSMSKIWHKVKYYYLTHDGIEMALFAAVLGSFAWIGYHTIVGIIGRFAG